MVKIEKLPSGSYRARVNIGGGKYKSITGKNKKDVQLEAAQFEITHKDKLEQAVDRRTLGEAIDDYITLKSNVLSPSTIRGYKVMKNTALPELMLQPLALLTQQSIQAAINCLSADKSPKYVRNVHGLISATVKQFRPELLLSTTMPQRKKSSIQVPTEDEMKKLFDYIRGSDIELPIYLAACCGMRRSEILGLKISDVDLANSTLSINEAIVIDDNGECVSKGTKTVAGTRTIRMYPFVKSIIEKSLLMMSGEDKYVIKLKGFQIYNGFETALKECGIKHYRFHDLRHYLVSVMLSLNIPKKYIADYVGHETENMIDQVYGHIMSKKKNDTEDLLQQYFTTVVMQSDTKSDTKK